MKASFSGAAGLLFAAFFKVLKVLRPDRPIHPTGVALTGAIEKRPGDAGGGILWIDSPGNDTVSARLSPKFPGTSIILLTPCSGR